MRFVGKTEAPPLCDGERWAGAHASSHVRKDLGASSSSSSTPAGSWAAYKPSGRACLWSLLEPSIKSARWGAFFNTGSRLGPEYALQLAPMGFPPTASAGWNTTQVGQQGRLGKEIGRGGTRVRGNRYLQPWWEVAQWNNDLGHFICSRMRANMKLENVLVSLSKGHYMWILCGWWKAEAIWTWKYCAIVGPVVGFPQVFLVHLGLNCQPVTFWLKWFSQSDPWITVCTSVSANSYSICSSYCT